LRAFPIPIAVPHHDPEPSSAPRRYLEVCRKAGDQQGQCKAYFGIAEAEQSQGNVGAATAALEIYLDLTKLEDPQGQAVACCSLGNIYFEQQQMKVAVTYFEKFFELARTLSNRKMLDAARVNLGVARGLLRFPDYVRVVNGSLPALLAWKNTRTPFQTA
jgi:tetratricopeptide (TPR) repeat protein